MFSGVVNKQTPIIDLLTVLTGQFDERDVHGWHVVMTPFFTVMKAVVDEGSTPLAYKVTEPTPALLFGTSGKVTALLVSPGDDSIVAPEPGVVQIQVFGSSTGLKAVR